ncbi:unnamed protein product [Cladocopium goreaui]|uniref:Dynein gamma chain, flagellar outer arm n=1 Tax=Cladocopium goreaui TaxID=2562237 RepID=A0A9P1GEB4_9DINO|nr:unnamed protein product [Cladocopium goreaui]
MFEHREFILPRNRETIMKVKLASVGYGALDTLPKKFLPPMLGNFREKFNILYALCEQQLSKQRHYDFGLRNILSVLRQSGIVKRSEPGESDEEMLFMRTVRDMNLSKLVADDVPLFMNLLEDLFPKVTETPEMNYKSLEETVSWLSVPSDPSIIDKRMRIRVVNITAKERLTQKDHFSIVWRPSLCGKSRIMQTLTQALTEDKEQPAPHKLVVMNPKAITDAQMYGVKDASSGAVMNGRPECWMTRFASIWQQKNNRALKYSTWIVCPAPSEDDKCDGPIDAIWIENLNTVLDDNKFEVESLRNASPATAWIPMEPWSYGMPPIFMKGLVFFG